MHSSGTPSVEFSLLGLLRERPMCGYELHQELKRKTGLGLIWSVKQALLYAILAKLEAGGLIATEVVGHGNRPARKVFHLTTEGSIAFESWVCTPSLRKDFRLNFLAKLHFARTMYPERCGELLAKQRASCAEWLSEMRKRAGGAIEQELDGPVYRYRIGQLESTLAWINGCIAQSAGQEHPR
jgi:DNA-binding PadR family transcriptional regulator